MTLIQMSPDALPEPGIGSPVLDRFAFTIEDMPFIADISTGNDPRVRAAREIEEDTFVQLGDIAEEVKEEFDPHDDYSTFIFLHHGTSEEPQFAELYGMGRLLPYNIEHGGLKTFVDLGKIAAQTPRSDEQDFNKSTRSRILDALDLDVGTIAAIDDIDERASLVTEEIERKFQRTYDISNLSKLVDIATLAPDMSLEFEEKLLVIDGLLAAMAIHTTDLYRSGKLTHLVQFTSGPLHHYLRDLYGYPVQELFGLSDLSYDSFGNGTEDNMVSTPSVLVSKELVEDVFFAPEPVTEHIGKIALAMQQVYQARIPVAS